MLGRYQGYSPLGGERENMNCIPLGTKMVLPVGIMAPGGSQLSWLGRGLGSPRSLTGVMVPEKPILSIEGEGRGFCKIGARS